LRCLRGEPSQRRSSPDAATFGFGALFSIISQSAADPP
jgi:hypothetical protein